MFKSHGQFVAGPCNRSKAVRNRLPDDQRVVPHSGESLRNAGEKPIAVMKDPAGTAMHRFGRPPDFAAEGLGNALEPEADTENRHLRLQNDLAADSEVPFDFGASGPGRKNDVVGIQREQFVPAELIIADHDWEFTADRRHHLVEIERERVVIVDDESFHEELSGTRRLYRRMTNPKGYEIGNSRIFHAKRIQTTVGAVDERSECKPDRAQPSKFDRAQSCNPSEHRLKERARS